MGSRKRMRPKIELSEGYLVDWKRGRPHGNCMYPFDKLNPPRTDAEGRKICSHFYVKGKKPTDMSGSLANWKRNNPTYKFTVRTRIENGKAVGVEVWRVE